MIISGLARCAKTDTERVRVALLRFGIAGEFPQALLSSANAACEFWLDSSARSVVTRVGSTVLPLFDAEYPDAITAWLSDACAPDPVAGGDRLQIAPSNGGLRQIIVPESVSAPIYRWAKNRLVREPVIEILAEAASLRNADNGDEKVLRATPADRERIAPLYPPACFNVTEFLPFQQRFELAVETGRLYYVERDGHPVAAAHTIAEASGEAQIMGVVTDPSWRKRGLARIVLSRLCHDLVNAGRRPRLMFEADNTITRTFYESLGFESCARFATIDLIPSGAQT